MPDKIKFIQSAGELLWPGHWRAQFEDRLNLSNRSLRRMLRGDMTVPTGLVRDIETILRDRATDIDSLLETIAED